MEPAPIPPHERSWRHPSELAAANSAAAAAADNNATNRLLAAAGGAVATALVVVIAVTVLPTRNTAPVAISATTMPPYTLAPIAAEQQAEPLTRATVSGVVDTSADDPIGFGPVKVASAVASADGLVLTGAPRAVAAPVAPAADGDAADVVVHLVTASHVYHVAVGDLDRIVAPDGAVVIADDGQLLGIFVNGRFAAD